MTDSTSIEDKIGSWFRVNGTFLKVTQEPSDALGCDVHVALLRQSKPGRGGPLMLPLTTLDKGLVKGLEDARGMVTGALGPGDDTGALLVLNKFEPVGSGEPMVLINEGEAVGIRESFAIRPGGQKAKCDLTLAVGDHEVYVMAYGNLVDEAEDTEKGQLLKVQFELASYPRYGGYSVSAVAKRIDVV